MKEYVQEIIDKLPNNLNPRLVQKNGYDYILIDVHFDEFIIDPAAKFEDKELREEYVKYLESCRDCTLELVFKESNELIGFGYPSTYVGNKHPHISTGAICSDVVWENRIYKIRDVQSVIRVVMTLISALRYIWPISAYRNGSLTRLFNWCDGCYYVYRKGHGCLCEGTDDDDEDYYDDDEDDDD